MKTIVLDKPGDFRLTETEPPGQPGPGEAVIAVSRVGICGTDLHAFRGRQPFFDYPRILGHELGVEVTAVGPDVETVKVGDHCTVEPYLTCGTCIACRLGKTNCCEQMQVLGVHVDGGMRERILIPAQKLHRSDTLTLEQLALGETLGIGAHAVERTQPEEGESVLVIGAGPIGLSVIQFAQVAGARVALLELNEKRAAFAQSHFDIAHSITSLDRVEEDLREGFSGELPTVVMDATGNINSMNSAFLYVANGGRLTFVGFVQDDVTFHDPEFHRRELTLLATRNARSADFTRILCLMESGVVDTKPWITHEAGIDDLIDAFSTWLEPGQGVVKAMMKM